MAPGAVSLIRRHRPPRPRLTTRAVKSSPCGVQPGPREPTRVAVACVRLKAARRPDGATHQDCDPACLVLLGRCSLRAAQAGLRAFRRERVTGCASAREQTPIPWRRAPEAVLVRRPGAPPAATRPATNDRKEREGSMRSPP